MTSLILLAAFAPRAEAAPYELDFQVTGVANGSADWDLAQDLLDVLNDDVVDVDLTLNSGAANLAWKKDGISRIAWSTNAAIHGNAPARAFWWVSGGVEECDVAVNKNVTWSTTHVKTDSYTYGGTARPLGTTLMHELGHCLQLGHVATEYSIMGEDWDHVHANANTLHFYLGEDSADKLVAKHDTNLDYEDVGVVHWRYSGNADGDAYGEHVRTSVQSALGVDLASYSEDDGDNPVYLVRAGQTIRPQFSFENNGSTNAVDVDLSYRLSTNDNISSSDDILETDTFHLVRGDVYTSTRLVTIPDDIVGRYSIGVRYDNLIGLTDDVPQNNATYIDIDVLENGDADYCEGPEACERFEGDCDADSDCGTGLSRIHDMGDFYGFDELTDVCDYPLGDPLYCSEDEPCARGIGDCDSDDECTGSLECLTDVGPEYGWGATVDVCGYPEGHANFCQWPFFLCDVGEGDCDSDLDCSIGDCASNVGAAYGWSATTDVCELSIIIE